MSDSDEDDEDDGTGEGEGEGEGEGMGMGMGLTRLSSSSQSSKLESMLIPITFLAFAPGRSSPSSPASSRLSRRETTGDGMKSGC